MMSSTEDAVYMPIELAQFVSMLMGESPQNSGEKAAIVTTTIC
jgi:hypothetical protein